MKKYIIALFVLIISLTLAAQTRHIEIYSHFANNDCNGVMTVYVQDNSGGGYTLTSSYWGITDTYQFRIDGAFGTGFDVSSNAHWLIINWYPNNGKDVAQQTITLTEEAYQTYNLYVVFYRANLIKSVKMDLFNFINVHDKTYFYMKGQIMVTNPNDGSSPNQWGIRIQVTRPDNSVENFYYHVSQFDVWENYVIEYNSTYHNNNFFIDDGQTAVTIFADNSYGDMRNTQVWHPKFFFEYVPNPSLDITSYNTTGDEYHPKISWDTSDFPSCWQNDFNVQIWRQKIPVVGSPDSWTLIATRPYTDLSYIDYTLISPSGDGGLFAEEGKAYYKVKLEHKTTALNYDFCNAIPGDSEWDDSFAFSNTKHISYGSNIGGGQSNSKNIGLPIENIKVSGTTVSFTISDNKKLNTIIHIYNLKGQKVKILTSLPLKKGRYKFTWDGRNENNRHLSSGLYLYKISRGNYNVIKKGVLVK